MAAIIAEAARAAYDLAFQISPIVLFGGLYPGGMPIVGLTGELAGLAQNVLTGAINGKAPSSNDFFARFLVQPGGTLINNSLGRYPFANQQVAANAIIQQPLSLSMRMTCPAKGTGYYLTKTAILMSLVQTLQQHCAAGGWFSVATPAYLYTNGILLGMTDITPSNTKNPQTEFQLDFEFPLISQDQASSALSTLFGKVAAGQPVTSTSFNSGATPGVFQDVPSS